MNTIATIAGLAIATTTLTASADVLLEIDLSVVNQITITATGGASSADVSGSTGTGVYLANIFSTLATNGISNNLISGDLVANGNSSDGTPSLYASITDPGFGLNIWSWTADFTSSFATGTTAFVGSATWDLSTADYYANLLAGNTSGDIYAFTDRDSGIPSATIIGQYNVVPAPGAFALLGLTGIAACRRNRA
tara:strand:+ start:495 stop:1076 length:582 start_codon:yes stop_codon:yes gene_type:complete